MITIIYISKDEYSFNKHKKSSIDRCRCRITWVPDIDDISILFDKLINVENPDGESSHIMGSERSLNINHYLEPLQWVLDSICSDFYVEFSIHKYNESHLNNDIIEYIPHIEIGFSDKSSVMAFKTTYNGKLRKMKLKV